MIDLCAKVSWLQPHVYPPVLKDELIVSPPSFFSYNGTLVFQFSPFLKLREPFIQAVFRQFEEEHQQQILNFFSEDSKEEPVLSCKLGESIYYFYKKGILKQLAEEERTLWNYVFLEEIKDNLLEWECCAVELLQLYKPLNMRNFDISFLSSITTSPEEYVSFLLFSAYKEEHISGYQLQWIEKLCHHFGLEALWLMNIFADCVKMRQNQREYRVNDYLCNENRGFEGDKNVKRKDIYFLEHLRRYKKDYKKI